MDITPPGDDKGLRLLKLENEKGEVKQTPSVSPYTRIASSEEPHTAPVPLFRERRQGQRRKGERRTRETHSPFDTRSGEERRKTRRRAADRNSAQRQAQDNSSGRPPLPGHIDEEV